MKKETLLIATTNTSKKLSGIGKNLEYLCRALILSFLLSLTPPVVIMIVPQAQQIRALHDYITLAS